MCLVVGQGFLYAECLAQNAVLSPPSSPVKNYIYVCMYVCMCVYVSTVEPRSYGTLGKQGCP